jgi:hypothetical protein
MRACLYLVTVGALLALGARDASAQVFAGAAFQVAMDHDGANLPATGTAFRLFLCPGPVTTCTTPIATQTAAQRVGGVVTFTVPGQVLGTYTLQGSALNVTGEAKTAVLVIGVTLPPPPPPAPPTNLRIVSPPQGP